jgi:hypothetical protein
MMSGGGMSGGGGFGGGGEGGGEGGGGNGPRNGGGDGSMALDMRPGSVVAAAATSAQSTVERLKTLALTSLSKFWVCRVRRGQNDANTSPSSRLYDRNIACACASTELNIPLNARGPRLVATQKRAHHPRRGCLLVMKRSNVKVEERQQEICLRSCHEFIRSDPAFCESQRRLLPVAMVVHARQWVDVLLEACPEAADFRCPLSHVVMFDPVTASDGITCSKLRHPAARGGRCPDCCSCPTLSTASAS